MKKLILALFFLSFNSFAKLATCDDVYVISNMASMSHYQKDPFNIETISKSLYTFIDIYDPYKIFLSKEDFKKYEIIFSDPKMIEKLMSGNCSDFISVHDKIQENKAKWYALLDKIQKTKNIELTEPAKKIEWNKFQKEYFLNTEEELTQYAKEYVLSLRATNREKALASDIKSFKKPTQNEIQYIPTNIIKAYVRALDPHSDYVDNVESKKYMEDVKGSMEGIGVELSFQEDANKPIGFEIKRLLKEGPAFKSKKIKVGDVITSIDGVSINKDNYQDVLADMSTEKATSNINLKIKRKNKDIVISLKKESISLSEIKARSFIKNINDQKILVIKMNVFYGNDKNENSTNDVINIYKKTIEKEKSIDGIVFDLRSNSGGLLEEAVKLTGLFIDRPYVLQTKTKSVSTPYITKASLAPINIKEPLVVLINKESASASEIFAGALKSYGRALIVGDSQTFGKGTVQGFNDKFDSIKLGKLKLTIAKFYFPNGQSPQMEGLHSDIQIPFITNFMEMNESITRFPYETDVVKSVVSSPIDEAFIIPLKSKSQSRIAKSEFFKHFDTEENAKNWLKESKSFQNTDEDIIANNDMILNETLNICTDWILELKSKLVIK